MMVYVCRFRVKCHFYLNQYFTSDKRHHYSTFMYALPILIVIIGSLALALYMLVISIKRKSTFNR